MSARERINEFTDRMRSAADQNLESIILYGSASRDDFNETYSDLNLLCAFRNLDGAQLAKLVPVMKWWSNDMRQRPPVLMTTKELRSSADVFAIEMLDMQAHHRVLYGAELVGNIYVPSNMHRLELERELRTTLLKLRQHLVFAYDDEEELKRVLIRSISTVLLLLRHALIVLGQPSLAQSDVLKHASETMAVDPAPFEAALALRERREHQANYRTIFEAYVQSLASVVAVIDRAGKERS